MEYKQKVYIVNNGNVIEGLFSEHWDYPMSYVHVGNQCLQFPDDCIFESKVEAILTIENEKVSRLESHIEYIEKEYEKLDNFKKDLLLSKKRIEDMVMEKQL